MFEVPDDIESALPTRYNAVLDLMECGGFFPTFAECVEAEVDPLVKAYVTRRIESAVPALFLPSGDKAELRSFLQHWDGMVESLVGKLEQLVGTLRRARSEYVELMNIVICP